MSDAMRTEQFGSHSDIGFAWFAKRAALAVVILCLSIGGLAWLLHTSIDPTVEARASENAQQDIAR